MIKSNFRRALAVAACGALALMLPVVPVTAAGAAPGTAGAVASSAPAPAVLSRIEWTRDNRLAVDVDGPAGTTYILAVDFHERSQTFGPVPAGPATLTLDLNGVPSPQLSLVIWRAPGAAQGSVELELKRPAGVPLTVPRTLPRPTHTISPTRLWVANPFGTVR